MIYLAVLRACENMATVMGDTATVSYCKNAFTFGQSQLIKLLWNDTLNYFRAYTGGDAIMGDCLYGQMLALHHGLGWLTDVDKIQSHLDAELKYNGDAYGIKVVTGRNNPPPVLSSESSLRLKQGYNNLIELSNIGYDGVDDVIWLGAAPDWSYVQIKANASGDITQMLSPVEKQLSNYRDRLRDLWNIVGIMTPGDWGNDENIQGMPYVTSHYGFTMTDYYLLPALSGQKTDLPGGILSFEPVYACPLTCPYY